jgi:uncharacterized protein (TIGR03086 family)
MDRTDSREIARRYRAIADGMDARVDGCHDDDWAAATPCPGWTVRDVLVHVAGVHRHALAALDSGAPEPIRSEHDPVTAWRDASAAMRDVLRDPDRATRTITSRYGEMPFEDLVSRMVCSDTLVHTWDVARATGQDERLDADAVAVAWTWMQTAGDRLRASGAFGPPVTPPAGDADVQTLLLCFLGRAA